jgi:hypothetical protein
MNALGTRPRRRNTYTGYAIGCAVVWLLIWAITLTTAKQERVRDLRNYFVGWASGWTSATIARAVYPPPRRRLWGGAWRPDGDSGSMAHR